MNRTQKSAYVFTVGKAVCFLLCFCFCVCFALPVAAAEASDGTSSDPTELSAPEQVFQVIGLLILLGGIALLPVYYVLNMRRKRIIRSFDKPDETDSNQDTSD